MIFIFDAFNFFFVKTSKTTEYYAKTFFKFSIITLPLVDIKITFDFEILKGDLCR